MAFDRDEGAARSDVAVAAGEIRPRDAARGGATGDADVEKKRR